MSTVRADAGEGVSPGGGVSRLFIDAERIYVTVRYGRIDGMRPDETARILSGVCPGQHDCGAPNRSPGLGGWEKPLPQRALVSAALEFLRFHVPDLEQAQVYGLDLSVGLGARPNLRLDPGHERSLVGDPERLVRLANLPERAADRPIRLPLLLGRVVSGVDPGAGGPVLARPLQALPQLGRPLVSLAAQIRPADRVDENEVAGHRDVAREVAHAPVGVSGRVRDAHLAAPH